MEGKLLRALSGSKNSKALNAEGLSSGNFGFLRLISQLVVWLSLLCFAWTSDTTSSSSLSELSSVSKKGLQIALSFEHSTRQIKLNNVLFNNP